jgi:hypothetical protein
VSLADISLHKLAGSHKRTAHALAHEVMALAREFGIEKLGFLTLTFAENLTDVKEANRRLANVSRRVIKGRYRRAIAVRERQARGAVHFHLVVVLDVDIRTGVNFEQLSDKTLSKRERYASAGASLKAEWAFWRETAPKYGFGRTELLPVKSNAEGIARYVGSYIGEHVRNRIEEDRGSRLVSYIGYKPGDRKASSRFSWGTERGWLWRQKVGAFLRRFGLPDTAALRNLVGSTWAYVLEEEIWCQALDTSRVVFPSKEMAEQSWAIESHGDELRRRHACCPVATGCVGLRGVEAMNILRRQSPPKRKRIAAQEYSSELLQVATLGALRL